MVSITAIGWLAACSLLSSIHAFPDLQSVFQDFNGLPRGSKSSIAKESFLDNIVANMTIPELGSCSSSSLKQYADTKF